MGRSDYLGMRTEEEKSFTALEEISAWLERLIECAVIPDIVVTDRKFFTDLHLGSDIGL